MINKFWLSTTEQRAYSPHYCLVHLKVGKRVNPMLSVLTTIIIMVVVIIKGQEGSLGGDGYVHSLEGEDSFACLYLSSDSSNCTYHICIIFTYQSYLSKVV